MLKFQAVLLLFVLAFVGCSQVGEEAVPSGEAPAGPTEDGSSNTPSSSPPSNVTPAGTAGGGGQAVPPATPATPTADVQMPPSGKSGGQVVPAAPSIPEPTVVNIPSGTEFSVRLAQRVSSATSRSGESFEATLDEDLMIDGHLVAAEGRVVMGELTEVVPSGKVKGRAKMSLRMRELRTANESYALQTNQLSFEAEGSTKEDALKVGIGAGVGAVIGAIAGGKKGAAIGTAIGGGGGTAAVVMTKGEEVEFGVEQKFNFQLADDLKVTLP